MEVHSRAENHVATVFFGLITDGFTDLADEFGVPSRGETRTDGEGCSVVGLVCTFTSRVDTYASGAVGENGCGDTEMGNGWGGTRSRITSPRYNEITILRYYAITTSHHHYTIFLVPLHSGYAEQLQNSLPLFMPFLAIRLIIGLPQRGHAGAPSSTLCSAR